MAVPPGRVLGFLGGGQLGRMGAMAARSMGYGVVTLDPDPQCCAGAVSDAVIAAAFDDAAAAARLAQQVDVVTYEIEKIGQDALEAVLSSAPLRPGRHLLHMVQDRQRQKAWLTAHGYPVGPYKAVDSAAEVSDQLSQWATSGRLKVRQGGYDGRGQAVIGTAAAARGAWDALGQQPCVLEQELPLAAELSVLVARRPQGDVTVFPASQNWHVRGILHSAVIPANLPAKVLSQAHDIARDMAVQLVLEGILACEFFLTDNGHLYVNELAPRPHNTFHTAGMACATGQFEQLIRAVCDLPLGSTQVIRPVALVNVLGDLWSAGQTPAYGAALEDPNVRLCLYGKEARPGRKVGHLLCAGTSPEDAVQRVHAAALRLRGNSPTTRAIG